jgi:hypothetical protein
MTIASEGTLVGACIALTLLAPVTARPAFLSEAAKMPADIAPTTGEDVRKLVAEIYATPKSIVDQAKKFFTQ